MKSNQPFLLTSFPQRLDRKAKLTQTAQISADAESLLTWDGQTAECFFQFFFFVSKMTEEKQNPFYMS